jgi:LacI family transcriptional regulator
MAGRAVTEIETVVSEMSVSGAYQSVMQHTECFIQRRSVYVYNDMIASGMLMAFKDLHIDVPEHIQMISNDDIPLASWMYPQLSTLRFPTKKLIEIACQRLVREIVSGNIEIENMQLSPELILRGTTLERKSL